MTSTAFTSRQTIKVTGVTQRQLAYWRKTGLIVPSQYSQGGHARYTFTDLVALRATKQLIEAGISIQKIRHSIASLTKMLPTLKKPLSELTLVATGDIILAFHQHTVFEAVSGQEWILPIAQLARRVAHEQREGQQQLLQQTELFPDHEQHATHKTVGWAAKGHQ